MLTRVRAMDASGWWYWPWHVLLIAAYPVLFLFAENAAQQVTLEPLWTPLAISLAGAVGLLLLCFGFRRDWARAGLMASALLALFFSFGHVWNLADDVLRQRWLLTAVWLVSAVALVGLAWRGGHWVRPATQILNLATAGLVLFNLFRIGQYTVSARLFPETTGVVPTLSVGEAGRPDIYYIVLDRYAGEETLRDVYDYDNGPFLRELEERGFAVAHNSWANYFKTAPSVVSTFSLDYLDPDAYNQSTPHTFGPIHAALQGRLAAPAALKSIGYEYVLVANWWEPSSKNVDADLIDRYTQFSQFSTVLAATTMLLALSPEASASPDEPDPEAITYPELARRHILHGFAAIERAAGRGGPTLTFAHLTIPHSPYVFNPDGSMPTAAQAQERNDAEEYVAQLEYANRRSLEVIDRILDVEPGQPDPIIILATDEGPWPPGFRADQEGFQWLEASDEDIAWKFGILNAYRMPGVDLEAQGFYDRISPVNAFRILFNAYFGTHLEILPDVTYLSPDYDHTYDFVEYPR
ncbi:MAG: hypothetical protein ACRDFR_03360 [Candidatus Limnocylindria bacterium]